jgi:hypothetical protein
MNLLNYFTVFILKSPPQDRRWFWSDGSDFDHQNWAKGRPGAGARESCIHINFGGTVNPVSFTDPVIKLNLFLVHLTNECLLWTFLLSVQLSICVLCFVFRSEALEQCFMWNELALCMLPETPASPPDYTLEAAMLVRSVCTLNTSW